MNLSIKDITTVMQGQLILGDPRILATGATVDSRQVEPGALFFAFKGENVDGHAYAINALRQGAVGVVVSHLDWLKNESAQSAAVIRVADVQEALRLLGQNLRNGFRGPVVGITGSNGKTTTKQMVASILKYLGPGLATGGNFNSQIGLPLVLARLKTEHKWMALELGASAPGHIAALAEMSRPTVGVITSIGPAHLATFGSIQRIAESKWELLDALPTDGCAVVPWAEPQLEPLIRPYKKKIVFFGEAASCPVRASAIEAGELTRFMLHIGSQNARVELRLPGRHNVGNALAAAGAAWVLGCPLDAIVAGLEQFEPPKMRMEILRHPSGAILINDAYNANPASMTLAIRSLMETYPARKRVLVLGAMLELGTDSEKYHFHLGAELARMPIDRVFLLGVEAKPVLEGAISAGAAAGKFVYLEETETVVDQLLPRLQADTVLFFKGSRGNHLERVIEAVLLKTPASEGAR